MKPWQGIVLAILIASISVLSACSALGIGKSKEQNTYEQQAKAYQDAINANNKAQEEYNKQLKQALEEYLKAYNDYSKQVQEQQLQQMGIPFAENQTQP